MYEIVIFRAAYYEKDCKTFLDVLEWEDRLWWFSEPDMTLKKALQPLDQPDEYFADAVMTCEAFKFEIDFVPNIHVRHFDKSFIEGLKFQEDGFEEFLPQLVEIARQKLKADPFGICLDFYVLFDVEYSTSHDQDGSVDDVQVYAEWVGELDFDKLPMAVVGAGSGKAN